MADSESSSICPLCCQTLRDARLLSCLHSFCKTCLGDLTLRTGHAHEISCPLCRSKCCLPETGASGLPKHVTVDIELTCECDSCKGKGEDAKPELWCTTCDVAFCKEAGFVHMLAEGDHHVKALPQTSNAQGPSLAGAPSRRCQEHDLSPA